MADDQVSQVEPQAAPAPAAAPPQSRLASIIGAVAKVASTGMAGIPNTGRPGFVSGLGQGARAEQAAEATKQDIKFKDFDSQMRAASLHNQDLQIHQRQEEQNDSHQKHQDFQKDWDEAHGISYDTIPNSGQAVTDHLTAQTTANGAATIPPGTHLSADGNSISVPKDTPETRAGQLQKYNTFGPILGLPSLPNGAQFVPPKMLDMLTHKMQGYDINGDNLTADKLPSAIASMKTQRDYLAENGGTPDQLKALDHTIAVYKSNLKADTDAHDAAATKASERKIAEEKAKAESKGEQTRETNAAKPQKAVDADWKPGVTAMQKNKTDLAENMVSNANSVASILIRRPDLVGSVAGRFTSAKQMMGNDDKDIAALGTAIHNIAMANNGIHGMKAHEGVEDFERLTLNHFKNGPQAVAGALGESAKSVQTFIDAARPDVYKTHSKNGGAIKAMVGK